MNWRDLQTREIKERVERGDVLLIDELIGEEIKTLESQAFDFAIHDPKQAAAYNQNAGRLGVLRELHDMREWLRKKTAREIASRG